MEKTYRSIFKWGDKREEKLENGVINLIKELFGYSDEDFKQHYLFGDEIVSVKTLCSIAENLVKEFEDICGTENVVITDYDRASHAFGYSFSELLLLRKGEIKTPPDIVIFPRNEEDIVKILEICVKEHISIIPMGGRSSVTRALETSKGGISLDLTKHFNKIIEVNEMNSSVLVQAGVFGPKLENYLNSFGKKYTCGHFPQSFEFSTVGGWVAARGAGQSSTAYGKIDDLVLALKIISPVGIIETKDYPASAQAWDLNKTFIGSEGCLGIITQIRLKIRRYKPQNTTYASFIFKNFESSTTAMREMMQERVGLPSLFRISDPVETETAFKIKRFNNSFYDKIFKFLGYQSGKRCIMYASFDGNENYTAFVKKELKKISHSNGGFYIGGKPTKKWLAQKYSSAYLRDPLMDIGIMTDTFETAVTWENLLPLWKLVREYLETREKSHIMAHISHVYENGANLYFTFLSPMKKGNEIEDYLAYHKGLVDTIHSNGGSLSHHHGIGKTLAPWMENEMGKTAIGLLQASKNYLDPTGILNPGRTLGLKSKF